MLGVLVLIVVAVWAMITVTKRHGAPVGVEPLTAVDPAGSARTRQILDERCARGELSTDDYTERTHARILTPIPAGPRMAADAATPRRPPWPGRISGGSDRPNEERRREMNPPGQHEHPYGR